MTISYPYSNGDQVVYTDGMCFVHPEDYISLPGIKVQTMTTREHPRMFSLTEGWWWVPPKYRMCVFTADEILNSGFLDITTRIAVEPNNFVYLEEELRLPPYSPGMLDDIYYDITFHDEKSLLQALEQDLSILDSGNLIKWKNKIQGIDLLYG